MDESSYLRTEHLARRFGVTTDTIVNWTNSEVHPLPYVRPGRFYLFDPAEVDRWLREGGIAQMAANDKRGKVSA